MRKKGKTKTLKKRLVNSVNIYAGHYGITSIICSLSMGKRLKATGKLLSKINSLYQEIKELKEE